MALFELSNFLFPEPSSGFEKSLMELVANAGAYEAAGQTYDYTSANSLILATMAERGTQVPTTAAKPASVLPPTGAHTCAPPDAPPAL